MNVDEKRGKVKRREEVPKWSTGEKNPMKPTEKVKTGRQQEGNDVSLPEAKEGKVCKSEPCQVL